MISSLDESLLPGDPSGGPRWHREEKSFASCHSFFPEIRGRS